MQESNKRLNVIGADRIVDGTTCFDVQSKAGVSCQRQRCPHWMAFDEGGNCVHIASKMGPHTLQRIGQIYNLTRMRICQIEKSIFDRIRNDS
jgi:hypothetical protein